MGIKVGKYETNYITEFDELDRTYKSIERVIEFVISGKSTTPIILEGPAGVGKSSMIKKFFEKNDHKYYQIVAGKITPLALYMNLYTMNKRGHVLVLDDTDTAMDNIDTLNILKAATDSKPVREVSWISSKSSVGMPSSFTTEGAVIILSNNTFANSKASKKHEHLKALESRSFYRKISDNNAENKFIQLCYMLYRQDMLSHLSEKEKAMILDFIADKKESFKQFDLRTAVKIAELYALDPENWRDMAETML